MDKNSLRSIAIVGQLASLAGLGRAFRKHIEPLVRKATKARIPKSWPTYRGCKRNKFASMSRQRLRAEATRKITAEVRASFQMPRRILRAIVRTRVNREWRTA